MKVCLVIPARYNSTRFPGKVIYPLFGKPVIVWIWERIKDIKNIHTSVVATDDDRVRDVCKSYGIPFVMTSSSHPSGTDRVWEVSNRIDADIYINLQGDEPFIEKEVIESPLRLMINSNFDITTAATPIANYDDINNPNVVKVVFENKRAIYFSRVAVPYHHHLSDKKNVIPYYRHVGIYVYKKRSLDVYVKAQKSILEEIERLEQLRALSLGLSIGVEIVNYSAPSIDDVSDLEKLEKFAKDNNLI